jgi:hypothetical protein
MKTLVLVIGSGGTGSMLASRIIAHVMGVKCYGCWNGGGEIENLKTKVLHVSWPGGPVRNPQFRDLDSILRGHQGYRVRIVLTTRDRTMSEVSMRQRFRWSVKDTKQLSRRAREHVKDLMRRDLDFFIWSYETFMYCQDAYLALLYKFLGVESDFVPDDLVDGNAARIARRQF